MKGKVKAGTPQSSLKGQERPNKRSYRSMLTRKNSRQRLISQGQDSLDLERSNFVGFDDPTSPPKRSTHPLSLPEAELSLLLT